MTAVAISNNDMVYLHWNVSGKIPDCLGFNIIRHDAISNDHESLPAMVGFPSPDKSDGKKGAGQRFAPPAYGRCRNLLGRICSPSAAAPTGTRSCPWSVHPETSNPTPRRR